VLRTELDFETVRKVQVRERGGAQLPQRALSAPGFARRRALSTQVGGASASAEALADIVRKLREIAAEFCLLDSEDSGQVRALIERAMEA